MMGISKALTIAGLDSGAGAGVTADLKTFHALGVYGMVALTSVTAQNTVEVRSISDVPSNVVEDEINVVAEDIGVDAAKTGMLSNAEIIATVSRVVKKWGFPLVVDPVMVAKSGARLLREDAVDALRRYLLPVALIVTPNIPEAEALTGISITNISDMRKAAQLISRDLGTPIVIVKGGHLEGLESIDVVYDSRRNEFHELKSPRVNTKNTHGTGCSFSAAIAAGLAKGLDELSSISNAKKFITDAIIYSLNLGHGHGPVNSLASLYIESAKYDSVMDSIKAAKKLISAGFKRGFIVSLLSLDYFRKGNEGIYIEFNNEISEPVFGVPPVLGSLTVQAIGKGLRGIIAVEYEGNVVSPNAHVMEMQGKKYALVMGSTATDAVNSFLTSGIEG
ncbi:MAG: bifunctional hydroxymethylpyrimidine kinase/phosphomethylpyrimidine kinase [Thermocladium sp.]